MTESVTLSARIQAIMNALLLLSEAASWGEYTIHHTGKRKLGEPSASRKILPIPIATTEQGDIYDGSGRVIGTHDRYFVGEEGWREEQIRDLAQILGLPRAASWGWVLEVVGRRLWALADLDDLKAKRIEQWCQAAEAEIKRIKKTPKAPDRPVFTCPRCERNFHPVRKDQIYCCEDHRREADAARKRERRRGLGEAA